MTPQDEPGVRAPGVAEVQELERKLESASDARAAADARVTEARERAERIVAEARERGVKQARVRREEALAELEHEQRKLRRWAAERGQAVRATVDREREAAVTAFVELVLPAATPRDRR